MLVAKSKNAITPRRTVIQVEQLEDRVVPSAERTLTVITHGFQLSPPLHDATFPSWATELASSVNSLLGTSNQSAIIPVELGGEWNGTHDFLLLDWSEESDHISLTRPVQFLTSLIQARLNSLATGDRIDLIFIGHSRGAILNNAVISAIGDDERIDFLKEIALDPTCFNLVGDESFAPTIVAPWVDQLINYDDGNVLVPGATFDGFRMTRTDGSSDGILNLNVGDLVDVFRRQASPTDYFLRSDQIGLLGRFISWSDSLDSHGAIHEWYRTGPLSTDIHSFLRMKDQPSPADEPNDTGYKPGGSGLSQQATITAGKDDFAQPIGPQSTRIQVNQGRGGISGSIETVGDRDFFQFIASNNGLLTISLSAAGTSLDPFLRLYDFLGNPAAPADDNSGGGKNARISINNAVAGRTYLIEANGGGRTTGSYRIDIDQVSPAVTNPNILPVSPAIGEQPDYPNDKSSAKNITLSSAGKATFSGAISPAGDDDWITFVARNSGPLLIQIDTSQGMLDSHLRLHNSGTLVTQDNDRILRTVTVGERYWLHIRAGDANSASNIESWKSSNGRYTVRISQPSATDLPDDDQVPLPGGPKGVLIQLNSGIGDSRGSIDEPQQLDWFEIRGTQAGFMQIEVTGVNDDLTPFLAALRADYSGIDTDSADYDGIARISFSVQAGEIIRVAVTSHEGKSQGGYTISVTQPDTPLDDDNPDVGEPPRDIQPQLTDEGFGYVRAKIENTDDNDWFAIPVLGSGYMTIQVDQSNSSLVSMLQLATTTDGSGWFESDDGRDGTAQISFLPTSGTIYARVSSLDGTQGRYTLNVWWGPDPNDDYADSGGRGVAARPLGEDGSLTLRGRLGMPGDIDAFRILASSSGPVAVAIVSLTEGFVPFLKTSWQTPNHAGNSDTDSGSGRGGVTYITIPDVMSAPDNWVNIDVSYSEGTGTVPFGDYILYVWQPQTADDRDPATVGAESSRIMLDGSGNGSLAGSPNGTEPSPGINHAGDVDVFQVQAASNRSLTFTVTGLASFIRVYDSAGRSIATDQGSGPDGASQITVDAERGELFYLEVAAFNDGETGNYTVQVSQPTDDHPDAGIFQPKEGQVPDATAIVLNQAGIGQTSGQISSVGDHDFFQVQASQRGRLIVAADTTDNQLDTFIRVYDSRGNLVALDDDGGDGRNSYVVFNTFQGETYFIDVSGYGDASIGAYAVTVQEIGAEVVELIGTLDNFNGGLDTAKWSLTYTPGPGKANLGIANGQVRLEADGRGAPDDTTATTLASRVYVTNEVSWDMAGEFGNGFNWGYAQVATGPNQYIRVQMNRNSADGSNLIGVSADGYVTQLANFAPLNGSSVFFAENTYYRFRIVNESNEIHVYMGDTLLARYSGSIAAGSYFQARSASAAGADRYAYLTLDNVAGHFALSDALPYQIVTSTLSIAGIYDDFEDSTIDGQKWGTQLTGAAGVQEQGGSVLIRSQGADATDNNNRAVLRANGIIQGDIEFDFNARLGPQDNASTMEVTDGTSFIRMRLTPNGSAVLLTVESSGYQQLASAGTQSVAAHTWHHVRFVHTVDGVELHVNATRVALFAGAIKLNSSLEYGAASDRDPPYDDFNDNTIDSNRWNVSGDAAESSGRMHLWMYRDGGLRNSSVSTQGKTGGSNITGFRVHVDRTAGTVNGGQAESEIALSNGTDEIIIKWLNDVNQFILRARGYYGSGDILRWDPDSPGPAETPDGPLEIRQAGNNIEVLHNNQVVYTFEGKTIQSGSFFRAEAFGQNGEGGPLNRDYEIMFDDLQLYTPNMHLAELQVDNVSGQFQLTQQIVRGPYDDFDDNSVNFDKWHVAGTVEERDGRLFLPLFRSGQPVTGYVSTAGIAGGMNLRGFRLGSSRTTEPKRLSGWDTIARVELTNGRDAIRISWDLQNNTFRIETYGAYGSNTVVIAVPDGEVPDGPLEVRERNGNIEVLHNNNVKLTIANQTIRAGSFFTFQTAGNPFGQSMNDPPTDFDASIDNLQFYLDPVGPEISLAPALKSADDSGSSTADHITNKLSLNFEWTKASDTTQYQWREGELLTDGTIAYGVWSQPQAASAAQVILAHGSVHVFSIRPIDAQGMVGEETSRAFIVDQTAPGFAAQLRLSAQSDPDQNGNTHSSAPTIVWTDAADDHGIAGYHWRLDGGAWSALQSESSANVTLADRGTHLFEVFAVDLAGNTGAIASFGFSNVLPDFRMIDATFIGNTSVQVRYEIVGDLMPASTIGFYRSTDSTFATNVQLVAAILLDADADRTVGQHTKTFDLGPNIGLVDNLQEYHVLAFGDAGNGIPEQREDNNTAIVRGVYHAPGGYVFVHGGEASDLVNVAKGLVVTLNGTSYTYADADVAGLWISGAGGDDSITVDVAKPTILLGGAGNDTINGGGAADIIIGGPGDDTLSGRGGNDIYMFDADMPLGRDTIETSAGGRDTLDFSATTQYAITINLGWPAKTFKQVSQNLVLRSWFANTIENVVGGAMGDSITGNNLSNVLDGGPGNDRLFGLGGRDILIGGFGSDVLRGGAGDDILIGSSTTYQNVGPRGYLAALNTLMAEWGRGNLDYRGRVRHLAGKPGGRNAGTFLNRTTLLADNASDVLFGEGDSDWFVALAIDSPRDKLKDKMRSEIFSQFS